MARVKIDRPDGSPSPYFWSDKEASSEAYKTIYKKTDRGVKRMKGVRYDPLENKLRRD